MESPRTDLDVEGKAQSPPTPSRPVLNTTAVNFKLQDPPRALYGWKLHMTMLGCVPGPVAAEVRRHDS